MCHPRPAFYLMITKVHFKLPEHIHVKQNIPSLDIYRNGNLYEPRLKTKLASEKNYVSYKTICVDNKNFIFIVFFCTISPPDVYINEQASILKGSVLISAF
ncbi:Hypothetical predicted protein [Marmota monax]|uniref:Nuclear receptor coactivator 7 n=1 Tax=Marmota monax TaxID=9995 RepID=A0A5E4AVL5_MARMO|nr:nuclear receptor coactivator 7 [Marmota monax]VTJ61497.1 Hypothetical predicted protein [Marmota monax]